MIKKLIQYISINERQNMQGEGIVTSTLNNPRSLDEFKITVIDLNGADIWTGDSEHTNSLYCEKDLENLSIMIKEASKTEIVLLYPQNCIFSYKPRSINGRIEHQSYEELKNILGSVEDVISEIFDVRGYELLYENTNTKIGQVKVPANFYFSKTDCGLTKSESSNKITTVQCEVGVLTTLSINTYKSLIDFLCQVKLIQDKEEVPE